MKKNIDSWLDLELEDLFYAYRKAKADCFFERGTNTARMFAAYESNIANNLSSLLLKLRGNPTAKVLIENLGHLKVVAKKLAIEAEDGGPHANGHGFFSDPKRAFDNLVSTHKLTPEFRVVGDFPVEMHILSALWVNLVGHKFDALLSPSAYGSRLRRYRAAQDAPKGTVGDYHLEAIGSFQPYFGPYKAWRENGLTAIRKELEADKSIIAVSMDLASYYHRIDPGFLIKHAFLDEIGVDLSGWELSFTKAFVDAMKAWSDKTAEYLSAHECNPDQGGLPIGLSFVRVAANVLLLCLDRDIERGLAPVYYGRYVDDIFLVIRDPGDLVSFADFLRYMSKRTAHFPSESHHGEVHLVVPEKYKGGTTLVLQQSKQKMFYLQGLGGIDLLDNIESQIRSVSSERRLMPSPERLEKMASAQVLTAAGQASDEADTLRRADGLSVRRLGWAIQLRAVETLARDLRSDDWATERLRFYQFARNHILRPDRILDHIDYLPRLLSLAVAVGDWAEARRLFDAATSAVRDLRESKASSRLKLNGLSGTGRFEDVWTAFERSMRDAAADAIAGSLRWSSRRGGMNRLSETALSLCKLVGLGEKFEEIERLSLQLRESDLAKISYKDHLRRDAQRHRVAAPEESILHELYAHEMDLREFLQLSEEQSNRTSATRVSAHCFGAKVGGIEHSLLPFLFPTRPYSTQEVSLFLPSVCVFDAPYQASRHFARYVRAVRGVWVWSHLVREEPVPGKSAREGMDGGADPQAVIGSRRRKRAVRLGISSLETTDRSFSEAASGRKDISRERYHRLEIIVNHAIKAIPRPTHLLLPELSIPDRWVDTISGRLREVGINLIAGMDYHLTGNNEIHSEAVMVLSDDRLGFPSSVQVRQPKSLPAPGEEEHLLKMFGRSWRSDLALRKPIYEHGGFAFGVLVCSELQNMTHRLRFQGGVDCVMVLSWNQDLETFSSLVEAASLDVHAHVALVNNRKYGDSRVRSPAKAHHLRDVCRLRGGKNEHVVVVDLDVNGLRAFQSRIKRWPSADDPYKPVPEGFCISEARREIPR